MREDIQIHIESGDMPLVQSNTYSVDGEGVWIENPEGLQSYTYCEIEIPEVIQEATLRENGVYVRIPYHPVYKFVMLGFKRMQDNGSYAYLKNPVNGSDWFPTLAETHGRFARAVYAPDLMLIADKDYYVRFVRDGVVVYSAATVDVNIVNSGNQNSNMLLSCVPGNNYRYPVSGVGLVRWINGPATTEGMARTINDEFAEDGVAVTSASFNNVTKKLQLISNASKVD